MTLKLTRKGFTGSPVKINATSYKTLMNHHKTKRKYPVKLDKETVLKDLFTHTDLTEQKVLRLLQQMAKADLLQVISDKNEPMSSVKSLIKTHQPMISHGSDFTNRLTDSNGLEQFITPPHETWWRKNKSYDDWVANLRKIIDDYLVYARAVTDKPNYKIPRTDLFRLIIHHCGLRYYQADLIPETVNHGEAGTASGIEYDYRSPCTYYQLSFTDNLLLEFSGQDFSRLLNSLDVQNIVNTDSITALHADAKKFFETLSAKNFNIPRVNLLPEGMIKFENVILDLKTKKTYPLTHPEVSQYEYFSCVNFQLHSDLKDVDPIYLDINRRIFNQWSSEDADRRKLLLQHAFCAIEGRGRGRISIFKSDGGDGKSTFFNMLKKLAGHQHVREIDVVQFNDDNKLGQLSLNTSIVVSDDSSSRAKMPDESLKRAKILTTGGSVSVNVKFQDDKIVQTNAMIVVGTNSEMRFYENTSAVKDRLIVYDWPNLNFRSNPETTFNLSELVGSDSKPGNKQFYEAFIYLILSEIDYFNAFSIPEAIKTNADEMLDDNDILKQIWLSFEDRVNGRLPYVLLKPLYEFYKREIKLLNPTASPLAWPAFSTRIRKLSKESGNYEMEPTSTSKRFGKSTINEFDMAVFNKITGLNLPYQDYLDMHPYVKSLKVEAVTDHDVEALCDKLFSKDELSPEQLDEILVDPFNRLVANYGIKNGKSELLILLHEGE